MLLETSPVEFNIDNNMKSRSIQFDVVCKAKTHATFHSRISTLGNVEEKFHLSAKCALRMLIYMNIHIYECAHHFRRLKMCGISTSLRLKYHVSIFLERRSMYIIRTHIEFIFTTTSIFSSMSH